MLILRMEKDGLRQLVRVGLSARDLSGAKQVWARMRKYDARKHSFLQKGMYCKSWMRGVIESAFPEFVTIGG